jgi:hypothetical protein
VSKTSNDSDDWSGQSAALFDAARGAHAPSAADRERVRSALADKLAAAPAAPEAGGEVQPRFARSATSRAALAKLGTIGLGVVCALAAATAFLRAGESRERTASKVATPVQTIASGAQPTRRAAEPESGVASTAATLPAPPGPAATARLPNSVPARPAARRLSVPTAPARVPISARAPEESPTSTVQQPDSVGVGTQSSRPSPQPDAPGTRSEHAVAEPTIDARAELELVARINAAVRASAPSAVLALCAEHEHRWPHGMFEPEREGARAIASCSSRLEGAGDRARAFLTRYPRTAIAARVREECSAWLNENPDP